MTRGRGSSSSWRVSFLGEREVRGNSKSNSELTITGAKEELEAESRTL